MNEKGRLSEKTPPTPEIYFSLGGTLKEGEQYGVSPVEKLMNEFEQHETEEREYLEHYRKFTEKSDSPLIRFLMSMIISDEEKHHAVMHAMFSTLKGSVEWSEHKDAIGGLEKIGKEKEELLKITRAFIHLEKDGIKKYRKLRTMCSGYYKGLFVFLLSTIIHDSEKHVDILNFIRREIEKR